MAYETEYAEENAVVKVDGHLDVAAATDLADYLEELIKRYPKKLVLDLSGVSYLASSGLAMLVTALKKSRASRVPFGVCGLTPAVKQTVEVIGLGQVLPIFQDVEEALDKVD